MDFKKLFTEKDINKHKVVEENIKKDTKNNTNSFDANDVNFFIRMAI